MQEGAAQRNDADMRGQVLDPLNDAMDKTLMGDRSRASMTVRRSRSQDARHKGLATLSLR